MDGWWITNDTASSRLASDRTHGPVESLASHPLHHSAHQPNSQQPIMVAVADLYAVLGVDPSASTADIKRAYKREVRSPCALLSCCALCGALLTSYHPHTLTLTGTPNSSRPRTPRAQGRMHSAIQARRRVSTRWTDRPTDRRTDGGWVGGEEARSETRQGRGLTGSGSNLTPVLSFHLTPCPVSLFHLTPSSIHPTPYSLSHLFYPQSLRSTVRRRQATRL